MRHDFILKSQQIDSVTEIPFGPFNPSRDEHLSVTEAAIPWKQSLYSRTPTRAAKSHHFLSLVLSLNKFEIRHANYQ